MHTISTAQIRGTDTNSLHRILDEIKPSLDCSDQRARGIAQLIARRVAKELARREPPLVPAIPVIKPAAVVARFFPSSK